MREILFRGKRIYGKGWVKGYYVIMGSAHQIYDGMDWYYIEPETIGQCTGLSDKNGKKIFESDIVEWYTPVSKTHFESAVIYRKEQSSFCVSLGEIGFAPLTISYIEESCLTVIGNIYDMKCVVN